MFKLQKGEVMTDEEISAMIADVDENNDGKLDYKEVSYNNKFYC